MGPFCVTQPNPTHYKWKNLDPTQPNTTNNGAYSLVVTYFYTKNLSCIFCQPSMFFTVITHMKNSVIISFKNKKCSKHKVVEDPTQPNSTHGSTQPMDNSGLNSTTRARPDPTGPDRTHTDPHGLCRRPARTQRSFSETRAAEKSVRVRSGPCSGI